MCVSVCVCVPRLHSPDNFWHPCGHSFPRTTAYFIITHHNDSHTGPGIFMYDIAPGGVKVSFMNLQLQRVATNLSMLAPASGLSHHVIPSAPITILHECRLGLPYCYEIAQCCAASFTNLSITDKHPRPFIWVDSAGGPAGTHVHNAITGDITVINANGCWVGGNGTTSLDVTCDKKHAIHSMWITGDTK